MSLKFRRLYFLTTDRISEKYRTRTETILHILLKFQVDGACFLPRSECKFLCESEIRKKEEIIEHPQ